MTAMRTRLLRLVSETTTHPDRTVLIAILVASVARLAYVTYLGDDLGGPDSNIYHAAGSDFARRGFFSDRIAGMPFWGPGYPLLVAAHYAIFGDHPYTVKLTQIVMVAGLTWVLYVLARAVFGTKTAILAGVGLSASLVWLGVPHSLMYEGWLALVLVSTVWLLIRFDETLDLYRPVAAGLLLGFGATLQNKMLSLVPLLLIWMLWSSRRRARRVVASLVLVAAVVAVVFPFVLRHQVVYGEPILLSAKNSATFVYGIAPDTNGGANNTSNDTSIYCPGVHVFSTSDYIATDRALFSCAIELFRSDPAHFLELLPAKFGRFWSTYSGPWSHLNNFRQPFDFRAAVPERIKSSAAWRTFDEVVSMAWIMAGFFLMFAGARRVLRNHGFRCLAILGLPIVWLVASHLVTFGDPRFRIPILPLIWMLQAGGVVAVVESIPFRADRSIDRGPGTASLRSAH